MTKKKYLDNDIVKGMALPIGYSLGTGMTLAMGSSFDKFIPAGITNPITKTGSVMADFSGPITTISAGGIIFNQLGKTQKKLKGGLK